MILEGVITNVANFGAFVDVGVHQDGLVHISEVANHYVADIHKAVKVGDIVTVRVIEIDLPRKRINLSMKLPDNKPKTTNPDPKPIPKPKKKFKSEPQTSSVMAEKLKSAFKNKDK